MRVWLVRKHAERIDGVDLRGYEVGDTIDLPRFEARLLMAEEWARRERRKQAVRSRQQRRATDTR